MSEDYYIEMLGAERAQAALRMMFYAVRPEGKLAQLVHEVTLKASIEAGKISPRLTGTLASAHRERMVSNRVGEVYIDPVVRNVILGGRPVHYGPAVHAMGYPRNWMERTTTEKGKMIVQRASDYWLKRSMP